MLKRFKPIEPIDGIRTEFFLPDDYIGGNITIFVNGILYVSANDMSHVYGFALNESLKSFNFYTPLTELDSLYVIYDSDGSSLSTGAFTGSGQIEIEVDKWQLCAIPVQKGYYSNGEFLDSSVTSTFKNYIVDQLVHVYAQPIEDLIELATAKVGDNTYHYNYVPGFTKEESEHNFQLVYEDNDNDLGDNRTKLEITGFWIKSKTNFPLTILWETI